MTSCEAFAYPSKKHVRRHGPFGYSDYESFRDWLRDEFCFRCVFCLYREQWPQSTTGFHIDHFVPVSADPTGGCRYENLLYACSRCNSVKNDKLAVPNPEKLSFGDCLIVRPDGTIDGRNANGLLLIQLLKLDDKKIVQARRIILETLKVLEQAASPVFIDWMRFPDDLPDLSRKHKHPPGNSRSEGIAESWLERKLRDELPLIY